MAPFAPRRALNIPMPPSAAPRAPQVQELCTGRTLQEVIKTQAPLKEERAAALFRGVVKSVLHCHQVREGDTQAERWRHG